MEVWLHAFLTSALEGDDCSASGFGRFTPVPIGWKAGTRDFREIGSLELKYAAEERCQVDS